MTDYIDKYLRELASKNFSPRTIGNYLDVLYPFSYFCKSNRKNILEINLSDARQYSILLLDKGLHPISINHYIGIFRVFYNWLIRHKFFENQNPFDQIKNRPTHELLPVFCIEEEIKRLYHLVEKDNKIKVQDLTMFDVFFSTGIRTSELCNLRESDISPYKDDIFLKIRGGKGNKDREVIMQKWGWEALQKHLIGIKQRGFEHDWIFPNQTGNKMLRQDVYKSIRRILSKVKDRKLGAHTLRHTFATYLINNGTPLKAVQIQLGHQSAATTQIYTHIDKERLKRVFKSAHPKA